MFCSLMVKTGRGDSGGPVRGGAGFKITMVVFLLMRPAIANSDPEKVSSEGQG